MSSVDYTSKLVAACKIASDGTFWPGPPTFHCTEVWYDEDVGGYVVLTDLYVSEPLRLVLSLTSAEDVPRLVQGYLDLDDVSVIDGVEHGYLKIVVKCFDLSGSSNTSSFELFVYSY